MALKYNSLNALDLTYDNSSKVLSILTNMVTTTSDNAIVWHIGDSQMLSGGLVYGHQYSGKHIESFDHLQGTARNIVATGPFIANVSSGIYRLKDNTWGNCSSSILTEFSLLEAASGNDNKTLGHSPNVKIRETLQKTIVVTTLSTECN